MITCLVGLSFLCLEMLLCECILCKKAKSSSDHDHVYIQLVALNEMSVHLRWCVHGALD